MALIEVKADGLFKNLLESVGGVFRKKVGAKNAIMDSIIIRDIAKDVVHNGSLSVDCFLVMMVHNGGKKLMPHSFKYRSIVNGYHDNVQMPRFEPEEYRHLELDYEYELLIRNICEKKEVDIYVPDMSETKLSIKLRFEKLRYARFLYLYDDTNAIWYVLIGTTQYNEFFDTITHKYEFSMAINKIKNMIKKY